MVSGYLLRDVINKISCIHFTSSSELHTLGALYESMLREMRDAAGDSGEIYTPRPVVRLMVQAIEAPERPPVCPHPVSHGYTTKAPEMLVEFCGLRRYGKGRNAYYA